MSYFSTGKMPIETTPCKFCGSEAGTVVHAEERMYGLGGDFIYQKCQKCGSLQLLTIPKELGPYYPADYYSFVPLQRSDARTKFLKRLRMKVFLASGISSIAPMYGYWLRKVHSGFSGRIADVGCGNGQLLYELHCAGYRDLHGFDPYMDQSIQLEKGLTLWKKRLEDSELTFDLIMMHHSFEHMEDPNEILKASFTKLNPGGVLLVRCPVTDAEVWKQSRSKWVQLDAPRHLIIPSVCGLNQLAEERGFEIQEVEFDSSEFQFWGTALYEKGLSLRSAKIFEHFSPEQLASWKEKALRYNQEGKGDQACFYFRKPIKS